MEGTARQPFEARDTTSGFLVECKMVDVKSCLQSHGDFSESPPCTFCNGQWTLKLAKRRHNLDIQLNRVITASSHKSTLKFETSIVGSNTERYFAASLKVRENWNRISFPIEDLFRSDVLDTDANIICLLRCLDCKYGAQAIPLTCSTKLGGDLLDLLISGEDSDVTINVMDREFRVDKTIIRARSPVFFSMLKHDMVEKRSGRVDISDCDPEVFQRFLEYVYTGELQYFSTDIVCSLYYISDKYQVSEVKEKCVKFMSEALSFENFCDIAALSIRHNELELVESANRFFLDYSNVIVEMDQWLSFLTENPVAANHFIKKALLPEVLQGTKRKLGSTTGVLLKRKRS